MTGYGTEYNLPVAVAHILHQRPEDIKYIEQLDITLSDGTQITVIDDISLSNNNLTDGSTDTTFPIGLAIERQAKVEFFNTTGYESSMFKNAEVKISVQVIDIANSDDVVGIVLLGTFTAIDVESELTYDEFPLVTLTLVDDMYKAEVAADLTQIGIDTPYKMLVNVCELCGITLADDPACNGYDWIAWSKMNSYAFPSNGSEALKAAALASLPDDITYRDILGYIAMQYMGNAYIKPNGTLTILSYAHRFDDETVPTNGYVWYKNFSIKTDFTDIPTISNSKFGISALKVNYTCVEVTENDDGSYTNTEGSKYLRVGDYSSDDAKYTLELTNPFYYIFYSDSNVGKIRTMATNMLSWVNKNEFGEQVQDMYNLSGEFIQNPFIQFMDYLVIYTPNVINFGIYIKVLVTTSTINFNGTTSIESNLPDWREA